VISGDENAIGEGAKRGFDLFNGKAGCAQCHSEWNFTDNGFHDVGLVDSDRGRGERLPLEAMQFAFKTPTLRNVDRRAPYMHEGNEQTLGEVIDFTTGWRRPQKEPLAGNGSVTPHRAKRNGLAWLPEYVNQRRQAG